MRIAVTFNQAVQLGGGFSQSLSIAKLIANNRTAAQKFFFITTDRDIYDEFLKRGIHLSYIRVSLIDKFIAAMIGNDYMFNLLRPFRLSAKHRFNSFLNKKRIDLVYFTSPSPLALITKSHNYILTVFDLCHRDYMEFPEVRQENIFDKRENFYHKCAPRAVKVMCDSDMGRQNLIRRYRLDENRVVSFPFMPSSSALISEEGYRKNYIDIRKKYKIPGDYIYYPAQFWPHKNHIYLLDGIKILLDKYNVRLNAVFSGSDKGNLKYVLNYAKKLGIDNQVYYTGFVAGQEIPYLYKQSTALVMPTYFGPTNIPPLEAFALKVPVLYSDLPGLRDQVGDAALLMDLANPESMARQLIKLNRDDELRASMAAKGHELVSKLKEDDLWKKLKAIFDEYQMIKKRWQC